MPVSEWARFRSKSLDSLPRRDALEEADNKTKVDANSFFDSRYVVLYLNAVAPEADTAGDFHGWMAVVDLEKPGPVCQVVLESTPRTQVPRLTKGDPKYVMQDAFRADANKALAKITEQFEVY